jgi:hypothetical protein
MVSTTKYAVRLKYIVAWIPTYGGYSIGTDIQLRSAAHAFEGKVSHVVVSSVIDAAVVGRLADTAEKQLTIPFVCNISFYQFSYVVL